MHIKSNIWFENDKNGFFGKGRIELLEQIDTHGSISAAAKAMKMSYKAAWDAVNEMNNLSDAPIVERETGGKGGGGTVLTEKGHATIALFKELETIQRYFWASLENVSSDAERLEQFAKRMTLRTSARNQLLGRVKTIQTSALGAEVTLELSGGEEARVNITRRSLDEMGIETGMELFVILKSSWVRLCRDREGAEANRLPCRLEELLSDPTSVEATVSLQGGKTLTISMKPEAFQALALKEGDSGWACFDPSDALLAI
ncbi:MAG: TOBE domain-containing protein [Thiovulaceae bacterium]|nr:TOBE domain-containing protein [Sulfurimonadaceae bacterium]